MATAPPVYKTPERFFQEEFNYNKAKGKRPIESGTDSEESDYDEEDTIMFRIEPVGKVFPKQKLKPKFDNDIFEMFSVVIDGIDVNNLSGYIGMSGNFDDVYLFKPEDGDFTAFINKDGYKELLMNGPTCQSFLTYDPVRVIVMLTDVKTNHFCRSNFAFETYFRDDASIYNTPLSATYFQKGFGRITFQYAVFNNGVAAKVEVMLLHRDNNTKDHRVVGEIYARDSLHKIRTCLFYKKEKPCVIPNDDDDDDEKQLIIPLSKSIVGLPNLAGLIIELNLTDSNTGLPIVENQIAIFQGPPEQIKMARWNKFSLNQNVGNNILVTVTYASLYE